MNKVYDFRLDDLQSVKQDFLPVEHTHHPRVCIYLGSCDLDLDLDPIISILKFDTDIPKTYLHTKSKLSRSKLANFRARRGQTWA